MIAPFVKSAARAVALLAMTAVPVIAQQDDNPRRGEGRGERGRGGPPFGGGMMGGRSLDSTMIGLLAVPQVREEVEVMPDQEQALQKLQQENRGERPEFNFREASDEERREMFEKMRKEGEERMAKMRAGLEEILLPEQLDRLREISIQVVGVEALNDSQIAKELKITPDQKEQITKVREQSQDSIREQMREIFSSGDRDAVQEKMREFRRQSEQKVIATLTQEQQQQFAAMKGEAFDLPEDALRFGGRRGGGDRGGDRGRDGDRGRGNRPRGGDDN